MKAAIVFTLWTDSYIGSCYCEHLLLSVCSCSALVDSRTEKLDGEQAVYMDSHAYSGVCSCAVLLLPL